MKSFCNVSLATFNIHSLLPHFIWCMGLTHSLQLFKPVIYFQLVLLMELIISEFVEVQQQWSVDTLFLEP